MIRIPCIFRDLEQAENTMATTVDSQVEKSPHCYGVAAWPAITVRAFIVWTRGYSDRQFVAVPPDAHFLRLGDQLLPEVRVSNGDDLLRPLPGGSPL